MRKQRPHQASKSTKRRRQVHRQRPVVDHAVMAAATASGVSGAAADKADTASPFAMCSSAPQPLAAATADNIPDLLALRSRAARESTLVVPDHPLPLHRPEIPQQHIRWGSEHVTAALLLVPVFVMASLLLAMPPRQVSRTSQLNSTPSITEAVARAAVIPRFGRLPQSRATANLALQSLPESKRNVRMSLVASASSSPSEQVEVAAAEAPADAASRTAFGKLKSPPRSWLSRLAARPLRLPQSLAVASLAMQSRPQSETRMSVAPPVGPMATVVAAVADASPFVRQPERLAFAVPIAVHDLRSVVPRLADDVSVSQPPFTRPPEAATVIAPALAPIDATHDSNLCRPEPGLLAGAKTRRNVVPVSADPGLAEDPERFGLALSAAAKEQTKELVVYNAAYMTIAYPRGDVPMQFGVCTDVVIRAYRALNIDLQELVHLSRAAGSDPNIDHRRTELLRKFFATYGEQLAVSPYIEDYRPGDIVTYYRPQNKSSTAHIAIVTDEIAPTGRPMIAHNRGWGVQLEDALFVDQMTGHYRFRGLGPATKPQHAPAVGVAGIKSPLAGTTTRTSAVAGAALVAAAAEPRMRLAAAVRLANLRATALPPGRRMGLGASQRESLTVPLCNVSGSGSRACQPLANP